MKSYKTIVHIMALSLFGALAGAAPAKAFCLVNCEPKPERREEGLRKSHQEEIRQGRR